MRIIAKSKRQSLPNTMGALATWLLVIWSIESPIAFGSDDTTSPIYPKITVEVPACPDMQGCSYWIDGIQLTSPDPGTEPKTFEGSDEVVTVELRNESGRTVDFQDLPVSSDVLSALQPRIWAAGAGFGYSIAPNHPFRMGTLDGKAYSIGVNARREIGSGSLHFEFRRDRESRVGKVTESIVNFTSDGFGLGYGRLHRVASLQIHLQWAALLHYARVESNQSLRTIGNNEEGDVEIARAKDSQDGFEAGIGLRTALLIPATDNVWFPVQLAVDEIQATNRALNETKLYTRYNQSLGLLFVF